MLTILAIMVFRLLLAQQAPSYTWAAAVANALAIEVFNSLWRHIAIMVCRFNIYIYVLVYLYIYIYIFV